MLKASAETPFFWIDDFWITGQLAKAVDAHFNQMKSLYTVLGNDLTKHERRFVDENALFAHMPKASAALKYSLWRQVSARYL